MLYFSSAPFFPYAISRVLKFAIFYLFFPSSYSFCIHHLISFLPPPPFSLSHSLSRSLTISPCCLAPFPCPYPFSSSLPPSGLLFPPSAHVSSKLPQGVGQVRPTDKSHQLYWHNLDSDSPMNNFWYYLVVTIQHGRMNLVWKHICLINWNIPEQKPKCRMS